MKKNPLNKIKIWIPRLLTIATSAISLVATIVYVTWFAASVDKRVSILEKNDISEQKELDNYISMLDQANSDQDQSTDQFRTSITSQLINLDGKIEKIYMVLLGSKKNDTG